MKIVDAKTADSQCPCYNYHFVRAEWFRNLAVGDCVETFYTVGGNYCPECGRRFERGQ